MFRQARVRTLLQCMQPVFCWAVLTAETLERLGQAAEALGGLLSVSTDETEQRSRIVFIRTFVN